MDQRAKADRFEEAIETGEILRVRYDGGTQPGSIRDIRPLSVSGEKLRAYDETSARPKLFYLEKIDVVSPDEPVTYTNRRIKTKVIDIKSHTKGWFFFVPLPLFASALGIYSAQRRRRDLKTGKDILHYVWIQAQPPVYDFEPGWTFYNNALANRVPWGELAESLSIQVISQVSKAGNILITFKVETFCRGKLIATSGPLVSEVESFVETLRTGRVEGMQSLNPLNLPP